MTDAAALPHLFEPLTIGPVTIRNRIVSSGHDTVMATDGRVSDQLIAYQEARARGGVGLIVVQVAGVHASARYTSSVLMADDDSCIPGLTLLADVVHSHGATIFQQLFHDGRELMESDDGTLPVAFAPSAVPNERFHVMPRAMPIALVREMIACYGASADRLRRAGFDGVEVVASHGYLPAQFLNPRINLRIDEYGGSPENRLRFPHEVLSAVREGAGPDLAVGLRISIGEESPDGLTPEESIDGVAALDRDGLLDYVSVVVGTSATLAGSDHIVPPLTLPNGYTAPLSARLKAGGVGAGDGGRTHQPAAGRRADPRPRRRRRDRDDPGPDMRPPDAGEGARWTARRDPRVHRLQPGLHRPLPRRLSHLVHTAPGDRPRTHLSASGCPHGA